MIWPYDVRAKEMGTSLAGTCIASAAMKNFSYMRFGIHGPDRTQFDPNSNASVNDRAVRHDFDAW